MKNPNDTIWNRTSVTYMKSHLFLGEQPDDEPPLKVETCSFIARTNAILFSHQINSCWTVYFKFSVWPAGLLSSSISIPAIRNTKQSNSQLDLHFRRLLLLQLQNASKY